MLLASHDTALTQELERGLVSDGYHVVTAHTGRETVELARTQHPHGILLDVRIAPPGYELCRALHAVLLGTPIILLHHGSPTREEQFAAVGAGAWDLRGAPCDVADLLLRLAVYIEPRLELDRVSKESLMDGLTGVYNDQGLARRAAELSAIATRYGLALACVVFRPADQQPSRAAVDRLAVTFRSVGRASDAVGRTGPAEFTIFAPATNAWTVTRLVRRLTDSAEDELLPLPEPGRGRYRTGYSVIPASHIISPSTLLARAREALESPRH